jgi:hypothetical protein
MFMRVVYVKTPALLPSPYSPTPLLYLLTICKVCNFQKVPNFKERVVQKTKNLKPTSGLLLTISLKWHVTSDVRFKTIGSVAASGTRATLKFINDGQEASYHYHKGVLPWLPAADLQPEVQHRKSCAIVGNSPALLEQEYGTKIGTWAFTTSL